MDVEPAVTVEIGRVRPVEFDSLLVSDEHWDSRAVLARVEHLLRFVARRIEVERVRLEHARRAACEVIAKDRRGIEERREREEHLVVLTLDAYRVHRNQPGEIDVLERSHVVCYTTPL